MPRRSDEAEQGAAVPAAEGGAPQDASPPAPPPPAAEKLPVGPPPAIPPIDPKLVYRVAPGKSVFTKRGMVHEREVIEPRDIAGAESFAWMVSAGLIYGRDS